MCYFWGNQMQWITSITTKSIWGALLASQQCELSDTLEAFRSLCSETITKTFRSQHLAARTSGHNLSKALFDGPSCLLAWLDLQYEETWYTNIGWRLRLSKQQECMYIIYCKYAILYASKRVDIIWSASQGRLGGWPALSLQLMSFLAVEQTQHS